MVSGEFSHFDAPFLKAHGKGQDNAKARCEYDLGQPHHEWHKPCA